MHTVFLDFASLFPADLDLAPLRAVLPTLELHPQTEPSQIAARIADAEAVIVNKVALDAELIAAAPKLRLILIAATGTDNVDLAAAAARGIVVCNCRGYGTASVAQHTMALLLALATRLPDYQRAVAAGEWERSPHFCLMDFPILELKGKTLGIVGYGELGRAVGRLAEAFGMQVVPAARPGGPAKGRTPLAKLLPRLDVLSLHCPLTPANRGLIGEPELRALPSHALLLNTARGGLVDEQALARALREGWIGGAGLDVLSAEPPPADHPLLAPDLPNLILTPHSAWGSREARQRVLEQVAENARGFLAGAPKRRVV